MKDKQLGLSKKQIESVMLLYSTGSYEKAIEAIKILNEKYPNVPLLFNIIGACYKQVGKIEGAAKMFSAAVNIKPDYAEAHFNHGSILKELGKVDEAIESYKKAISIQPNYPDAYNNLGIILNNDKGNFTDAIENFEWAVAYQSNFAEAHNNLGLAFSDFGKPLDAIESFKKAIFHKKDYGNAYFNLAMSLKDIGDKDGFLLNIKKALKLKPQWGAAHLHLSRVEKLKKNDLKINKMKSFLLNDEISLIDRIGLNFALAHVYENLDNHEEQFKFLNEANSLRKLEVNYNFKKDKILFERIKKVFKFLPNPFNELSSEVVRPIFILGMPRSGTSLVHQILDSHNQVHGAGELNYLNKFVTPSLKNFNENRKNVLTDDSISNIRLNYTESIKSLNIQENVIVDKMPLNFRYIGFILSAFPDAKILHMRRDSMATCWSIYKYYFNGNYYSFDQKDLAKYYLLYKDLMEFWNNKFPDKIYDVSYEDLTSNQEVETQKILNYCELEWDENCLNFHKNQTAVKTTSALQVRKKIYQGSSEVWKKYEVYLKTLLKELNYYQPE